MAGVPRYNFSRQQQDVQESPLFERQMGSEEYIELQQMRSLVDNMQHRISNLEKMNVDLEQRLEDQAKQSMAVEKECLLSEQRWKVKNSELLNEIETWKSSFKQEKVKGDRLREQVHRSERELYGILQRKYEMMRGPGTNKPGLAMGKGPSNADIALGRRGEINHSSSMRDDEYVQASKTSRNKVQYFYQTTLPLLIFHKFHVLVNRKRVSSIKNGQY